jgi:hypothetical protein
MKQYVGDLQHRLIAGRPVLVSEEMVRRNLTELKFKAAAHMIELRTRDGRLVDLNTMEAAPPAPPTILPHPVLDSVANDKTWKYPPGWKFVPPNANADGTMPQILKDGEKPALFSDTSMDETIAAATEPTPAPEDTPVVSTDAELEAALAAAQAEATPAVEEGIVAAESTRRDRNARRSR